jgi:6-phosphogluconolactonase (cycloisomerase 2 family)
VEKSAYNKPSDTLAVWAISNNGSLTRIQSAMAFGSRQIRAMELSPAGLTASAGGQDYIVAGGLKTENTFVFRRDRLNGTLELVAQTRGTYQAATYLWLN